MTILDSNFPDASSVSPRPTGIRYGVMLGVISLILSILFIMFNMIDLSGQKSNLLSTLVSFAITIVFFVLAILYHRDKELGGKISLGRAISVGFWVALISSVIAALGMFIYYQFIDPDYLNQAVSRLTELYREKGVSEEQIETTMSMTKMLMTPMSLTIFTIIGNLFWGVIISLIIGLVVKRD